jgi:long-chain acyl-CoA synthetase
MMRRSTRHANRLDPRGKTIPQLLLERAGTDGSGLAQRHKTRGIWKRYSWNDVLAAVRDCSLGLAELGLKRRDVVALVGENEPELFRAEHAALAQGAVVVCMYPDLTAEEMEYILSHSGAVFLFAQDQEQTDKILSIIDRLPHLKAIVYWDPKGLWSYSHPKLLNMEQLQDRGSKLSKTHTEAFEETVANGRPQEVAVLLYSSGTTGKPKAVPCSHDWLIDNALRFLSSGDLPSGAEYLSYISPAWGTEQFFGITLGIINPMVVNFPERPESLHHDMREIGVEGLWFTPRQWESLASELRAKMLDAAPASRRIYDWGIRVGMDYAAAHLENRAPSLLTRLQHPLAEVAVLRPLRDQLGLVNTRIAACGGAAMAPDVFRLFHAIGVPLRNAYGSTEFGMVAMHRGKSFDLETVGHLLSVDPWYGRPLEWRISTNGELQVRGGTGFPGYLNHPEKTAERLDDGWFCTGDHCAITNNAELVFFERIEDLRTLSTGFSYPPQFIETRLRYSPFIKDVMIVGDERTPYPIALINIDAEVVGRWAEERSIGFSTFADLSQREEVRELVRGEIEQVNKRLEPASRVARFANLPKELDPDEGELTRTRKLRRTFLAERYATLIDGLYGSARQIGVRLPVRYQDGRVGEFKAAVFINSCKLNEVANPGLNQEYQGTIGAIVYHG